MTEPYLSRKAASKALIDAGFPMKPSSLATLACRGGGPPYRKFGRTCLYRLSDLIEWAESRTSEVGSSATEINLKTNKDIDKFFEKLEYGL